MDMTPSNTLLLVAGVLVLSHLQAIHGSLLHNGMLELETDPAFAMCLQDFQVHRSRKTSPPESHSSMGGSLGLLERADRSGWYTKSCFCGVPCWRILWQKST